MGRIVGRRHVDVRGNGVMRAIARDARGLAYAEYLMVTLAVSLPVSVALLKVGALLLDLYQFQQRLIRFPLP